MKKIKLLANVNIEKPIIEFLIKKGVDIKWVADINKRMFDLEVLKIANDEQRILITNDKDFGELVFNQRKTPYGIVLLRIKGQNVSEKIVLLDRLLDKFSHKIINHFVVVTKQKIRFIPREVK